MVSSGVQSTHVAYQVNRILGEKADESASGFRT